MNDTELVFDMSTYSSDSGFMVRDDIAADVSNLLSTSNIMSNAIINNVSTHINLLSSEYGEYLKQYTEIEEMSPSYMYKPSLYSLHKYGTRSMFYVTMMINDILEPMDFDLGSVKFLNKEGVLILISILTSFRNNISGSVDLPVFDTIKNID